MSQEILRQRLAAVAEALKDLPGVVPIDIRAVYDGSLSVNKKGQLRLPICLPAKDFLHDPLDVSGAVNGQWKAVPILVFVKGEE